MVGSAVLIMVLGLLFVAPVHAEVTFDSWVGQWFKGTVTDKGVIVGDLGTGKVVEKVSTYGYVYSWDGGKMQYTFLLIQFDANSGTWMDAVPYVAQVVGGTPLNYVSYGLIPPGTVPEIEIFALIINVTAKEKKGVLTNPKVNTVGGCVIYNLDGGLHFAANESLNFKSVPVEKVPIEVLQKIL